MKKVLIVEDELVLVFVMKTFLEYLGHRVVATVMEGEDAIKAVVEQKPDIILMDIRINGHMDGIETMKKIREFSQVPVIFNTANADQATRQRAAHTENSRFLVKPVTKELLKEEIGILLG